MSSTLITIATIYALPVLLSSPTCDVTKPAQDFQRVLEPGENPDDDYVYTYYLLDASQHTMVMSKGQANTPNVYTAAALLAANQSSPQVVINSTPYPHPCGPVPAGDVVRPNPMAIFNQLPILVSLAQPATGATGATGAAAAPDPDVAKILAIVTALATLAGVQIPTA